MSRLVFNVRQKPHESSHQYSYPVRHYFRSRPAIYGFEEEDRRKADEISLCIISDAHLRHMRLLPRVRIRLASHSKVREVRCVGTFYAIRYLYCIANAYAYGDQFCKSEKSE